MKTVPRFAPNAAYTVPSVSSIFVTIAAYVRIAQAKTIIASIVIIVRIVCKCALVAVVKTVPRFAPNAENAVRNVITIIAWNAESVTSALTCARIANRIAKTASPFVRLATNARIA